MPAPPPDLVDRFRRDLDETAASDALDDRRLLLAVSGGPDSLALLLLAQAVLPGRIEAATVDHQLRAESADEAAHAGRLCGSIDVPHTTLAVRVEAGRGLQAQAREARYAALAELAAARDIAIVATGHHLDDQAETLLMRMNRGSGIRGLSGIRPARLLRPAVREAPAVSLVRPLLNFRRAELTEIVEGAGWSPIDDPTNRSALFDRTHARRTLADADWLDPARLAAAARNLGDADAALEWIADREWAMRRARPGGAAIALLVDDLPDEVRRRLVAKAIEAVCRDEQRSPAYTGPELSRCVARLAAGEVATLSGVVCRPGERKWTFALAPPRRGH